MKRIAFFIVFLLVLLPWDADAQCAMCKAVSETGEGSDGVYVAAGLNNGILYLMGVPYILLFILFRTHLIGFFTEFRALYRT